MGLPPTDFESVASAIPPLGLTVRRAKYILRRASREMREPRTR
jgi:hypothetical protein